jgi:hypothetical protein
MEKMIDEMQRLNRTMERLADDLTAVRRMIERRLDVRIGRRLVDLVGTSDARSVSVDATANGPAGTNTELPDNWDEQAPMSEYLQTPVQTESRPIDWSQMPTFDDEVVKAVIDLEHKEDKFERRAFADEFAAKMKRPARRSAKASTKASAKKK